MLDSFKCFKQKRDAYDDVFNMLHMTKLDREIVRRAYQNELASAKYRYYYSMILYTILNNIITIGSVLVVSFMSVEKINFVGSEAAEGFFWAGWIISIVVVVASKLVGSFSLQKKFVMDKIALEKYRNEGWKFASRIGPYRDKTISESFKHFINKIQRIKMRLVETTTQGDGGSAFNSQFNLNSSGLYHGHPDAQGAPKCGQEAVSDRHKFYADENKIYSDINDISPEIFNKFEYGDIEIAPQSRRASLSADNIDTEILNKLKEMGDPADIEAHIDDTWTQIDTSDAPADA
jgi:hypothetical protein